MIVKKYILMYVMESMFHWMYHIDFMSQEAQKYKAFLGKVNSFIDQR